MAFRSFLVRIFTAPSYTSTVLIAISLLSSSNLLSQSQEHLLISQSIEVEDVELGGMSDDLLLSLEGAFRVRPNRRFIGMTWRLWAYKMIRPEALKKSLDRRSLKNKEPGGLRYGVRELFGEPPSFYDESELFRTSSKMTQILNQGVPTLLVLDDLSDPGNVGTLIRRTMDNRFYFLEHKNFRTPFKCN